MSEDLIAQLKTHADVILKNERGFLDMAVRVSREGPTDEIRTELSRLIGGFLEAKKAIRMILAENAVLSITDLQLQRTVHQVQTGHEFELDRVAAKIERSTGEPLSLESELEKGLELHDDLVDRLIWQRVSSIDYVEGRLRIQSLILGHVVPDNLEPYVSEARESYANGLWVATVALARTALEVVARDICERTGRKPPPANVSDLDEARAEEGEVYRTTQLLKAASDSDARNYTSVKGTPLYDDARKLYGDLCNVVHARSSSFSAITLFERTLKMIQRLYAKNGPL